LWGHGSSNEGSAEEIPQQKRTSLTCRPLVAYSGLPWCLPDHRGFPLPLHWAVPWLRLLPFPAKCPTFKPSCTWMKRSRSVASRIPSSAPLCSWITFCTSPRWPSRQARSPDASPRHLPSSTLMWRTLVARRRWPLGAAATAAGGGGAGGCANAGGHPGGGAAYPPGRSRWCRAATAAGDGAAASAVEAIR